MREDWYQQQREKNKLRVRIGIVGEGRQGERWFRKVRQLEQTAIKDHYQTFKELHSVIVATPSEAHRNTAMELLQRWRHPVLVEKPTTLTLVDTWELYEAYRRAGVTLATIFTHLFAGKVQDLVGKEIVKIRLGGPERVEGPCGAWLDWGVHAWALQQYLGADAAVVETGWFPQKVVLVEASDGTRYDGAFEPGVHDPMAVCLKRWIEHVNGTPDPRFSVELALKVAEQCEQQRRI